MVSKASFTSSTRILTASSCVVLALLVNLVNVFRFAHAEVEAEQSKISIVHTPLKQKDLPAPGAPLNLEVTLKNSRETGLKLRAFLVRDGKLLDLPLDNSALNENDRPIYSFRTVAPIFSLSYQFVLQDRAGNFVFSTRYSLERPCLPNIELTNVTETPGEDRVATLVSQARALETENTALQRSLKLTEELRGKIEKP